MTKQERKLKSMLNYFEIDLKGIKDEKLSKQDLDMFLNKFNQYMDYYILEEIIKNIKSKREDEPEDTTEDEDYDPMLPKKDKNKKIKDSDELFDNSEEFKNDSFNLNDPLNTDINKFLRWLTLVLYSGDHSVIITEDSKGIFIKLIKINKGKK